MTMVNSSLVVDMVDASQAYPSSEVMVGDQGAYARPTSASNPTSVTPLVEISGKRKRNRNWTHSEVLLLIEAKKSEADTYDTGSCMSRDKLVSSGERWKRVVEHMKRNGIDDRDVAQCKGKWDNLLSDYKTIKGVLKKTGRPNYFSMSIEERRKDDPALPCYFDKDLFDRLDSFLCGRAGAASLTDMSTTAQSTHGTQVRNGTDKVASEEELGSSGKKKKQSGSDVVAAITKLTNTYMAAVTSMEEKRDARHKELLQFEREKLQTESNDRRELAAQLANLAVAFNRVADNIKDM